MPDHHHEVGELLRAVRRERRVAVDARLDRRDLERAGRAAHLRPAEELGEDGRVGVHGEGHGVEQRHVDVIAVTGAPRREPRRDRAHCGIGAGHPLADPAAGSDRRALGVAAAAGRAAPGLQRELGRGPVAPRAVLPERRDRHDHERGVAGAQRRDVERAGRAALDDDVRTRAEVEHVVVARFAEHDALRRVEELEQRPGRPGAHGFTCRRLDLDDVGTRVSEQLRAVRTRDLRRDVDDASSGQHAGMLAHAAELPHRDVECRPMEQASVPKDRRRHPAVERARPER